MNNVIQIKDLLTMLATSITIIVAIYYALNVFFNMEKEEKIMNICGYNRKSINVPLISFIIVYSIFPIFGLLFYKLDNFLLESAIIFTYITIVMLCISFPVLNMDMIMGISILILIPFTLINIIGIAIDISTAINININSSRDIIFLIFIISIIISILIGSYIFFNKSSNNSYSSIYLFISSIIGSCLFCNLIIYFQLFIPSEELLEFLKKKDIILSIPAEELLKKLNVLLFLLYLFLGLGIFNFNNNKYKKTELKKIEITLKKDVSESNKYENKLGFIISETNDDIVFDIDGILHRYRKSDIFCIKEYITPDIDTLNNTITLIEKIKNNIENIKNITIDTETIKIVIKHIEDIKISIDSVKNQILNSKKFKNIIKIDNQINNIIDNTNTILTIIDNTNTILTIIDKKKTNNNKMMIEYNISIDKNALDNNLEEMKTNCTEIKNQISDLKQKLQEQEIEKQNQETPS